MAAYSYNTANAGSYGAQDMAPQRKKKPGIAAQQGSSSYQAQPVIGGPTEVVKGGMGARGNAAGHSVDVSTLGGYTEDEWRNEQDRGALSRDDWAEWNTGKGGTQRGDNTQLGVITRGQGNEDENDQALMDVINELLTEGPRSTEEIEGVIGEQYDRSMQDELGRVMAAAGAGGMGSSGQLGYGMADIARSSALDRSGAILEAQRDAEKDWLDQINAAGNLYGTDLEIRSMDDYYRLMEQILGPEGGGGGGGGEGDDGISLQDEDGNYTVESVNRGVLDAEAAANHAAAVALGVPDDAVASTDPPDAEEQYGATWMNGYTIWTDAATGETRYIFGNHTRA